MPPGENQPSPDDGDDYYMLDEASVKDLSFVPLPRPKGPISKYFRTQLVWSNIISISSIHLIALYAIIVSPSACMATWPVYMWFYMVTGLGVTAGAHRLWTHKSYKAHWSVRLVLMILNTGAFQNHIIEWSRDHRTHHKFSETDADPHNAHRGFFFAHCGWLMCRKHPEVIRKGKMIDISDLEADPILAFQRRFYPLLVLIFAFIVPTIGSTWVTGDTYLNSFLIPGILRYVCTLHITWSVNSAAHMWGAHPYDKGVHPAENIFVSVGAIGEGFHNYHHCFPWDYSTSEYGPILNGTTCVIDIAAALGLVWNRKKASTAVIKARRARTGDQS